MNARMQVLVEDVLTLSADERSVLAAALVDSLETEEDSVLRDTWRAELLRRRQALREGVVIASPWAEVRARLSAM